MLVDVEPKTTLMTFSYRAASGWSQDLPGNLDSDQTLVLAFAHPRFRNEAGPLSELRNAFPKSTIMGCSTAGEILNDELHDNSIAVAAIRFTKTEIQFACSNITESPQSFDAGRSIAQQLSRPGLKAVFVISTGLVVNGSELVRGLNESLPDDIVVTGGLAGDGSDFKQTWVLDRGVPTTTMITAVGLFGDAVRVGHGSRGGFDPFGPQRLVTRAKGNELFELDGKPALALYREYLGDRAKDLPSSALLFPLSVRSKEEPDKSLVRTILAIDEAAQSLTFAGDIPNGATAQLMRANFDRLVTAAGQSSQGARVFLEGHSTTPTLSIAISCVGRRLILGERTEEELESAMDALGPNDKQIGFYSYGELSPFASGKCDLHNQTMTITTICEQ